MSAQRIKNERISISEIEKMLGADSFYDLSPEVIDLAYEEARARVIALASNIDMIQGRMMTLAGWFSAAEISLVGVFIGLVSSTASNLVSFWMCLYGVVSLGAIIIYLVSYGLCQTEVIEAGDTPKHFLDSEVVEKLKAIERKEDQLFHIKVLYLSMFQEAAMVNKETNDSLVCVYRRVLKYTLIAVATGATLLLVLASAL